MHSLLYCFMLFFTFYFPPPASTLPFCVIQVQRHERCSFYGDSFISIQGQLPSKLCIKSMLAHISLQYYLYLTVFALNKENLFWYHVYPLLQHSKIVIRTHLILKLLLGHSFLFLSLSIRLVVACVNGGSFVNPPSSTVYTAAEENVLLPCTFQPSKGEVVIQVIWTHIKPDGTEEQIITAHHQDGQLGICRL